MEQNGKVRRGYFISGCGGAQFASPSAIEALRACKTSDIEDKAIVLSAVDPANPYGAAIPWPSKNDSRCLRSAGALVVLHNGSVLGYLAKGFSNLVTFAVDDRSENASRARVLAESLIAFAKTRKLPALHLPLVDGQDAAKWDCATVFLACGFILAGQGLLYRNRFISDASLVMSD